MPGQQNCQYEDDAGGERLREAAGFAYDTNKVERWISCIGYSYSKFNYRQDL